MIGPKKKMWGVWIQKDIGGGTSKKYIFGGIKDLCNKKKFSYNIAKEICEKMSKLYSRCEYILIPYDENKIK